MYRYVAFYKEAVQEVEEKSKPGSATLNSTTLRKAQKVLLRRSSGNGVQARVPNIHSYLFDPYRALRLAQHSRCTAEVRMLHVELQEHQRALLMSETFEDGISVAAQVCRDSLEPENICGYSSNLLVYLFLALHYQCTVQDQLRQNRSHSKECCALQVQGPLLRQLLLAAALRKQVLSASCASMCGHTLSTTQSRASGPLQTWNGHRVGTDCVHSNIEARLQQLDPFITASLQKGILLIEELMKLLPKQETFRICKKILVKYMQCRLTEVRMPAGCLYGFEVVDRFFVSSTFVFRLTREGCTAG